jgi:hypothetical protein
MKYLLSIILIISAFYQSAYANNIENYGIKEGQRVRVEIDTVITKHILFIIPYHETQKIKIAGDISFEAPDSVTLLADRQESYARRIANKEIKHIWISEGKRRATLDGALLGAGSLAGWSFIFASAPDAGVDSWGDLAKVVGISAAAGAISGCIIGWFCEVDKWREVKIDKNKPNFKLGFAKNSFGLMATIHF